MSRVTGTCKWFNDAQSYGFLVNEAGEDVFVHYKQIECEGFKTLREQEVVTYIEIQTPKGLQAQEVYREQN